MVFPIFIHKQTYLTNFLLYLHTKFYRKASLNLKTTAKYKTVCQIVSPRTKTTHLLKLMNSFIKGLNN